MLTSPDAARSAGETTPNAGERPSLVGLRLLAQAVSGRPLEIRPETLTDRRAYVSGNTVVIDATMTDHMRAQVVIQAAMLSCGSFDQRVMRSLMGRSRSAGRYCILEGTRAVRTLADAVPGSVRRQVEDLVAQHQVPATANAEESRKLALGKTVIPATPEYFGQVKPLHVLRASDRRDLAMEVEPAEVENAESSSDEEPTKSILRKAMTSPISGNNPIARLIRNVFSQTPSPGEDADGAGPGPSGARATAATPASRRRGKPFEGIGSFTRVLAPRAGTATYPEWNDRSKQYQPEWVTVHETQPWNPEGARETDMLGLDPGPALKRGLAKATLTLETRGRSIAGEQLHPDGAVDLAQWRMHPGGIPPLPFAGMRRTRPDAAVMVLLDASDSTQDDTTQGTSVFDQHVALAYRLTAGCESVGLPVGLYGFQTLGRGLVRMLRVKSFGERLGGRTRDRVGHLAPAGYTRMGGAIRHATQVLEGAAPGMKRVLILVSDGFPYDEDYEGGYATADTRQAMLEARKLGIGCVCVGITAPSPEQLHSRTDALAAASALHVGDTTQIERRIGALIRQALRDARRRGDHTA